MRMFIGQNQELLEGRVGHGHAPPQISFKGTYCGKCRQPPVCCLLDPTMAFRSLPVCLQPTSTLRVLQWSIPAPNGLLQRAASAWEALCWPSQDFLPTALKSATLPPTLFSQMSDLCHHLRTLPTGPRSSRLHLP